MVSDKIVNAIAEIRSRRKNVTEIDLGWKQYGELWRQWQNAVVPESMRAPDRAMLKYYMGIPIILVGKPEHFVIRYAEIE